MARRVIESYRINAKNPCNLKQKLIYFDRQSYDMKREIKSRLLGKPKRAGWISNTK
jgi:hypothetical protein